MKLSAFRIWSSKFRQKVAVLAGVVLVGAFTSQLPAQTASLAYANPQNLPGSENSAFSYIATAVDPSGNIFMIDAHLNTVLELPVGKSQLQKVNLSGSPNLAALATDSMGNLYIANNTPTAASIIKLTSGGAQSNVASGWQDPLGVAIDAAGDLFVLDFALSSVGYTPQVFEVPANTNSRIQLNLFGMVSPFGIAADPAGDVFVADYGLGSILELPYNSPNPETVATGLSSLGLITSDLAGNVFFLYGQAIGVLPAGGGPAFTVYQDSSYVPVGFSQDGIYVPTGSISVDANGNLIFPSGSGDVLTEVQRSSVNFGSVDICVPGLTTSATCTATQTLWLTTQGGAAPTIRFLSGGVASREFTVKPNSLSCSSTLLTDGGCTVAVTFSPLFAGTRSAVMQLLDSYGNLQSSNLIYGMGVGPQAIYSPNQSTVASLSWPQEIAVDAAGNVYGTAQNTQDVEKFAAE